MKRNSVLIIVLGFVLILGGLLGTYNTKDTDSQNFNWNRKNMMGNNSGDFDQNYLRMNNNSSFVVGEDNEMIELEELKKEVESYLSPYDSNLIISDIFIFEDSEYYFSIIEEDTGRGAMELLVNQFTGDIFPEFGPNMMWNLKYGMMSGRSMMSGRGMMSGGNMMDYNNDIIDNAESNEINNDQAFGYGKEYLEKYASTLELSTDSHEFYGYYTFHVEEGDDTVGMLSVNAFTGEVWYHVWHGNLLEVLSVNDDEH